MDTHNKNIPAKEPPSNAPYDEVILKSRIAQICDSVGYNAITQDSYNILVDIYRRTIHHLARHCKDAANNNRRVEPTTVDLVQAYDFVGINIPDLQEYIETVKLPPLNVELTSEEQKSPIKLQRNILVDDLEDGKQNGTPDNGENKDLSENGPDEEEKPSVPLLKDTYEEIANKFTDVTPVVADKKIRLGGRVLVLANTKLKISTPVLPEPTPSTAGADGKLAKKKKKEKKIAEKQSITPTKQARGKKKKLSKEVILPEEDSDKEVQREKIKLKIKDEKKDKAKDKSKTGKRPYNKKAKVAITPLDPAIAEPPSFFPLVEENLEQSPVVVKKEKLTPSPKIPKEDKKKKKRKLEEIKSEPIAGPSDAEKPAKGRGKKKQKKGITPLDLSIAEPPSFLPILEDNVEVPRLDESLERLPTPLPAKQLSSKGKKKKKSSSNQFAIVTETVTDADKDEKEWFCPACGSADDGDWVQCDTCQEWYHLKCTGLKKAPEDDENWECLNCSKKAETQKKSQAPIEPMKINTPEPVIKTSPLPTTPQPPIAAPSTIIIPPGMTIDDLCPECNLPDDGTMMIQCDDPFCAKWFHGKCVNLLEEPKEDESWFCKACIDKQQSAFKRRRRAK